MKAMGVTATLIIGKHRRVGEDWQVALSKVKLELAFRRLNPAEYVLAMMGVGMHGLVTGKGMK